MTDIDVLQTDFYELLAVEDTASEKQLRKAFRKQAVRYHPDKNPSAEAASRFHLLSIALECLTDPEQRSKYDDVRQQKQAAHRRRERIEGERKSWIDELERAEGISGRQETRKRKREEEPTSEDVLAFEGARLRAELSKKMRAERFLNTRTGSEPSVTCPAGPSIRAPSRTTLKVRLRGHQIDRGRIKESFMRFGHVVDIVYKLNENNATQSALVEFADHRCAKFAFDTSPRDLSITGLEVRRIDWLDVHDSNGASETTAEESVEPLTRVEKSEIDAFGIRRNASPMKQPAIHKGDLRPTTQYQSTVLEKMRARQQEKDKEK